jgi:hypothetical protein
LEKSGIFVFYPTILAGFSAMQEPNLFSSFAALIAELKQFDRLCIFVSGLENQFYTWLQIAHFYSVMSSEFCVNRRELAQN